MPVQNVISTLDGIYRGKVVDNNDPDKCGRVRIRVFPYFENIKDSLLPWAAPAFSLFDGSGQGTGGFAVPREGSFVFVFFEMGDIYQPVYFAEAPTASHGLPASRVTNYPDSKVYVTKNGMEFFLDDFSLVVKVNHPSGTYVRILGDGSVEIKSVGTIVLDGNGDVTIKSTGNVHINP